MLYGIFFNGAGGGSVTNVIVDHIFQFQNFAFGSCQTGRAIRADDSGTVTITNTVVRDYQKSGFEARGSTIMNVSGSTAGPPHPLNGFSSQNAVSIVGASATIANNTIHGSGNQGPGLGRGNGTGVLVQSGAPVTIDHNIITGAGTNIGVSVSANSTNVTISFNQIGRTSADAPPDDPGIGVDVDHPTSSATLICNTFSGWITNIVGAVQISCTPLPNGTECITYSADTLSVEGGTAPFTWSVSAGTLPPGLTLAPSTGAITGTPTAAGTFNFTVMVVDSTEPTLTAAQAQTITIAPGCASTVQVIKKFVGDPSSTTIFVDQNGTAPYDASTVAAASGASASFTYPLSTPVTVGEDTVPAGYTATVACGSTPPVAYTGGAFPVTSPATDGATITCTITNTAPSQPPTPTPPTPTPPTPTPQHRPCRWSRRGWEHLRRRRSSSMPMGRRRTTRQSSPTRTGPRRRSRIRSRPR